MSTRCQIGFYDSPAKSNHRPDALIYRHSDGYPDTEHGVLAVLLPFAEDFHLRRGLSDSEYAAARALVALVIATSPADCLGYGICGDHGLHGDIEYFYRVDPTGVTVYTSGEGKVTWYNLVKVSHHPMRAVRA